MFKLAAERRFKTKITIKMPNETEGHTPHTFTAIFKALKLSEMNALRESVGDTDLLKEVLVGFEKVMMEDGSEAMFSPETRDALLDEPLVVAALAQAYLAEAVTGQGRQKN